MILSRQDNFNWLTSGGNSRVVVPDALGVGVFVITEKNIYLCSKTMDGSRLIDEEIPYSEVEYLPLKWFEKSPIEKALEIGGTNPVSDTYLPNSTFKLKDIYKLHYPLSDYEFSALAELGSISEDIITKIANEIKPGMLDFEVEAMFLYEFAKHNIQCDVLLIGTDERIFKYRHPNPSGNKISEYTLLHPAVRKNGLHCNITRSVYFGNSIPTNIKDAHNVCSILEANSLAMCVPGTKWESILEHKKQVLQQLGFKNEWKNHFPGGRTGYMITECDLFLDKSTEIVENEAYDWFETVTGAKVEELAINYNGEISLLSVTGKWPTKKYEALNQSFFIPQIMTR